MSYDYYGWRPYVSVAERRRQAAREMAKLKKKGHPVSPVVIEGRTIASTFWGKSWCENLERYSDYANRVPRGRTYVRNGSVVDLQVGAGEVTAYVSGSELYKVKVTVAPVPKARFTAICTDCAGAIDSLVELLQGRFSQGVMERLCQQRTGLFPAPADIKFSCSCPDWAAMCKHVAAVLYGIGARLDTRPELLFRLRQVDEQQLIAHAGTGVPLAKKGPARDKVLGDAGLSELFGIDLDTAAAPATPAAPAKRPRLRRAAPRPRAQVPAAESTPAGDRARHRGQRTAATPKAKARPRVKGKPRARAEATKTRTR
ncbi:MAG: hypothetical protein HY906_25885 [Deltaproteobacteria bacterium]|nr:hypothetical protein [Deltaproteobacteria bacterium]